MNTKKIISILAFAMLILTAYQCGDKNATTAQAAANSTGTAAPAAAPTAMPASNKPAPVKKSGSFVLNGNFTGAENLQLFFDKSSLTNSNQVIDKTSIDGSGNFELVVSDGIEAGVYRFRIGAQKGFLILDAKDTNVKVSGDLQNINKFQYQVEGSQATKEFMSNMTDLSAGGTKRPTMEDVVAKIKSASSPLTAAWLAHTFFAGNEMGLDAQKVAMSKMVAAYPGTQMTRDLQNLVNTNEAKIKQRQALEKIKVGELAPDIALKSPDGKTYKLSQLKGKVVLLDFWASWCGPCRRENPNVVSNYNKYNSQGFEVFSVSLDGVNPRIKSRLQPDQLAQQEESAKTKWKSAIQKDGLKWKYHVSDLQHWGSPIAKEYGISSIPKTFLIDRNGKIAAINPRGPALEPAVQKLL